MPVGRARDLLERLVRCADEAGAEEQILGWVAGDGELGEDDEIGACAARLGEGREDPLAVAVEVADDGVQLRESDPQGFRLIVANLPISSRR